MSDGLVGMPYSKYLELSEPFFTVIGLGLREGELYKSPVTILGCGESDRVLLHVAEIISGIRIFACSQTLRSCYYSDPVGGEIYGPYNTWIPIFVHQGFPLTTVRIQEL